MKSINLITMEGYKNISDDNRPGPADGWPAGQPMDNF
jgi:hypothetical protein